MYIKKITKSYFHQIQPPYCIHTSYNLSNSKIPKIYRCAKRGKTECFFDKPLKVKCKKNYYWMNNEVK